MASADSTHEWELYKENAAPLERGRNVHKLSAALAPKASAVKAQRQEDDKNIRGFERLVRPSEKFAKMYEISQSEQDGNTKEDMLRTCKVDKDPIIHWLRYIKYHEETYPSDTHAQFLLKERSVISLLHHPKYTNDVRFIRVCVLYADSVDDPHGQFKLFHKHKVGSEVAIFWLAWAWVAEKNKDFQFAEKIFRKAIQKKAQPDKIVNQRYKQFQRRMSRYWLNANANNPESVYDEEDDGTQQQSHRGALSGLTEEGVRQNHRGRGANEMARSLPRVGNAQSNPNPIGISQGTPGSSQTKGFAVFTDDEPVESGYDLNQSVNHVDENAPLPRLVKQNDRTKENTLEAGAWNERGGLNSQLHGGDNDEDGRTQGASSVVSRWAGTGGDSITAGGTSSQPAFQVFVDEECIDKKEQEKSVRNPKLNERSLKPLRDSGSSSSSLEVSLRPKLSLQHKQTKPIKEFSSLGGTKKTKKASAPLGSDKKLISEYKSKKECCFEEQRAKAGRFKVVPSARNFNLLHKMEDLCMSQNSSCMEIDDASTIEEVEMEDISRSMSMIREDEDRSGGNNEEQHSHLFHDSEAKKFDGKKVLFGANTSIGNQSTSRVHNTSTASSTIDERDAVGVVGDREETLNTKFAARELSMMFSSPAGFMNKSSALSSKKTSEKLLFSIHRDNDELNSSLDKPAQRVSSSKHSEGAFAIFCDDGEEKDGAQNRNAKIPRTAGFAIYEESESEDDSFEGNDRNGDTASLADIMDIMKATSPDQEKLSGSKVGLQAASGGFSIFCEDDSPAPSRAIDNGTVLTEDTATFGDLSFIPSSSDGDTCNLNNKIKTMALS